MVGWAAEKRGETGTADGLEEGRRRLPKSLKMLFTRNSIIHDEEVRGREGGERERPNPHSELFGGRPTPRVALLLIFSSRGGLVQETAGPGMGNEMMAQLSP